MRRNRIYRGPEQGENLTCVQGTENGQCVCSILREKKVGSEKTLDHYRTMRTTARSSDFILCDQGSYQRDKCPK